MGCPFVIPKIYNITLNVFIIHYIASHVAIANKNVYMKNCMLTLQLLQAFAIILWLCLIFWYLIYFLCPLQHFCINKAKSFKCALLKSSNSKTVLGLLTKILLRPNVNSAAGIGSDLTKTDTPSTGDPRHFGHVLLHIIL